ncbi:MAG: ABC transporter permease [Euryarchaeota archaeon]|nr:ABC transporter permease [Euryarchaeota archaeon]
MFMRILGKSIARRKQRVAIAIVAVVMGAAIASALMTTSMAMKDKVGQQFRNFGANIVVIPKSDTIEVGLPGITFGSVTEQRYINESDLWKIKEIANWSANVLGYAPFLYQVVGVNGSDGRSLNIVLAGTYFNRSVENVTKDANGNLWATGIRRIAPYWDITGKWVKDGNDRRESIVGTIAAKAMGLSIGSVYSVNYVNPDTQNVTTRDLEVTGIVNSGGAEDSQIFVDMEVAQEISNRPGKVHSVQVSALCTNCPAELIGQEIEKSLPTVQAKSVKQLVLAENQIMMQLEQTMTLVTVVALGASALGVMTTMTTNVIERRKEIGLLKSIGADNRRIAALFLTEAAIIGLAGGAIGYGIGLGLAQFIGQSVFQSSVEIVPIAIPITMAISVGIALLASALPVRRATQVEPAAVLRGE